MAITDYGLKWVKPNVNVDTAGLKDTLLLSSKPVLKKVVEDTDSINIDTDGTNYDITVYTHNLGYEPQYEFLTQWVNMENGDLETTYISAPVYDGTYADLGLSMSIRPYMTTTALKLAVSIYDGNSNNHDIDFIYKIYYDPDEDL